MSGNVLKQSLSSARQAAQPVAKLEAEVIKGGLLAVPLFRTAKLPVRADAHGPYSLKLLAGKASHQRSRHHNQANPSDREDLLQAPMAAAAAAKAAGVGLGS